MDIKFVFFTLIFFIIGGFTLLKIGVEMDVIKSYGKKDKTILFIEKLMPFVVLLFVLSSVVFMLDIFKSDLKLTNYFYIKAELKETYVKDGLLGNEVNYIKFKASDGTEHVFDVSTETYLKVKDKINKQLYFVVNNSKNDLIEVFFDKESLNKYIDKQKASNREVVEIGVN